LLNDILLVLFDPDDLMLFQLLVRNEVVGLSGYHRLTEELPVTEDKAMSVRTSTLRRDGLDN